MVLAMSRGPSSVLADIRLPAHLYLNSSQGVTWSISAKFKRAASMARFERGYCGQAELAKASMNSFDSVFGRGDEFFKAIAIVGEAFGNPENVYGMDVSLAGEREYALSITINGQAVNVMELLTRSLEYKQTTYCTFSGAPDHLDILWGHLCSKDPYVVMVCLNMSAYCRIYAAWSKRSLTSLWE